MNKAKRMLGLFCVASAALAMTGCSGINYTHGVSPASFLLLGLVNNEEPKANTVDAPEEVATVRVTQNL